MRKWMFCVAVMASLLPLQAGADLFGAKQGKSHFKTQTRILDTRAKTQYSASFRLQPAKV